MICEESAFFFPCESESLLGICAAPAQPNKVGVVIVVGGPQYRIGSHRQFTLLARSLGAGGIATFRFDCRGMGDSTGDAQSFNDLSADIHAAIDAFLGKVPNVTRVVLWGLCDAASAACFYAPTDPRVAGLVLANPWIRTDASEARAYLRHYYIRRALEPDFWRKVWRGGWQVGPTLRSLFENLVAAANRSHTLTTEGNESVPSLPQRVAGAVGSFGGPVLILLSGQDIVAREFDSFTGTALWRDSMSGKKLTRFGLLNANHTFASALWRDEVAQRTVAWIAALDSAE